MNMFSFQQEYKRGFYFPTRNSFEVNVMFAGTIDSMTQPLGPKPLSWSYNICLAEKRGKLMVWKARGWLKELHTLGVHPWASR